MGGMQADADSGKFAKIRGHQPKKSPKRKRQPKSGNSDSKTPEPVFQKRDPNWPQNMYAYASGKGFFFERKHRGRKIREPLGKSINPAMRKALVINERIDRGDYDSGHQSGRRVTVERLIEITLDRLRNRAVKTQQSYKGKARHFQTYLSDCHPQLRFIRDVTPEIARVYVEWREKQQVTRCGWRRDSTPTSTPSPKTVRHDITRLRNIFQYAVDQKWLAKNPFEGIRIPKLPGEKKSAHNPLSESDVRKLLKAAGDYDANGDGRSTFKGMMYDMTQFFLLTGLRLKELIYLPWQHVNLNWGKHGIIEIKPFTIPLTLDIRVAPARSPKLDRLVNGRGKSESIFKTIQQLRAIVPHTYVTQHADDLLTAQVKDWDPEACVLHLRTHIVWKQKASEGRVPLIHDSRAVLDRRMSENGGDSPFVFPHPDRGPLRSSYWAEFQTLLKSAKLRNRYRVHDLRHTFGTTLRRRGVPLETIMGLMRHASIEETQIYAEYDDEEGALQIEKLSGFGG